MSPGDHVRLARLTSVASPLLRQLVGRVGWVVEVKAFAGTTRVCAAFQTTGDDGPQAFWFSPGELEATQDARSAPLTPATAWKAIHGIIELSQRLGRPHTSARWINR